MNSNDRVMSRIKAKVRSEASQQTTEDCLIAARDALARLSSQLEDREREVAGLKEAQKYLETKHLENSVRSSYNDGFNDAKKVFGDSDIKAFQYTALASITNESLQSRVQRVYADMHAQKQVLASIVSEIIDAIGMYERSSIEGEYLMHNEFYLDLKRLIYELRDTAHRS